MRSQRPEIVDNRYRSTGPRFELILFVWIADIETLQDQVDFARVEAGIFDFEILGDFDQVVHFTRKFFLVEVGKLTELVVGDRVRAGFRVAEVVENENPDMGAAHSFESFEASVSSEYEAVTIHQNWSVLAEFAKACLKLPALLSVWLTRVVRVWLHLVDCSPLQSWRRAKFIRSFSNLRIDAFHTEF